MGQRSETSAGGVVYRRGAQGVEVVVGAQRDRLTGARTLRLPKGKGEPGESLEQTATREVAEEIGVAARVVAPLGESHYAYRESRDRVSKRVVFFLMEHVSGEPHARDREMQEARWCPIDEAAASLTWDNEREAVERARALLAAARA
jgi:8-oxo-dGTP pyrophosphatase MutT (NUDIX family)